MRAKILLWLFLSFWAVASWAAAGKIEFVSGEASVRAGDGKVLPASKGMEIESGQVLETGNGKLQIRFSDGGLIFLAAHTSFQINAYHFSGSADGSEQAIFRLLRGGLRTITGAIGKQHQQQYRVETEVATIGIRGTHYQLRYCAGDCQTAKGKLEKNGLYAFVSRGAIHLANDAGSLDIATGKTAYVADRHTPPQRTDHMPMAESMASRQGKGDADEAGESRLEAGIEQSEEAMRSLAGLAAGVENLSGMREEGEGFLAGSGGYQSGEDVFKVDGRIVIANLHDIEGGAASDVSASSAIGTLVEVEKNVQAYVDPTGAIRVVTNSEGSASNATTGVYDTYQDSALFLSRWGGPGKTGGSLNATLSGNQSIHWLLVKPYESPLSQTGSATYDMVAATHPTSSNPASPMGTLNSATVTVNFGGTGPYGGLPYAHYNLSADIFQAVGDAGIDAIGDFETGNHGTAPGTVTGTACVSACAAYVHGLFAGNGVARGGITVPSNLGLMYEIRNSPTSAYHGAAGLNLR